MILLKGGVKHKLLITYSVCILFLSSFSFWWLQVFFVFELHHTNLCLRGHIASSSVFLRIPIIGFKACSDNPGWSPQLKILNYTCKNFLPNGGNIHRFQGLVCGYIFFRGGYHLTHYGCQHWDDRYVTIIKDFKVAMIKKKYFSEQLWTC